MLLRLHMKYRGTVNCPSYFIKINCPCLWRSTARFQATVLFLFKMKCGEWDCRVLKGKWTVSIVGKVSLFFKWCYIYNWPANVLFIFCLLGKVKTVISSLGTCIFIQMHTQQAYIVKEFRTMIN